MTNYLFINQPLEVDCYKTENSNMTMEYLQVSPDCTQNLGVELGEFPAEFTPPFPPFHLPQSLLPNLHEFPGIGNILSLHTNTEYLILHWILTTRVQPRL